MFAYVCRILVDNIPIRVIRNKYYLGVPFPTRKPMKVYTNLWNGDSWATRWGKEKIDWSKAPFIVGLRNFNANACIARPEANCMDFNRGRNKGLNSEIRKKLKEIYSKWAVYNYCRDFKRHAHGLPNECRMTNKDDPTFE